MGAARAYEDNANVNLPAQVDAFLSSSGRRPSDALYTIEMGGNDIRDALVAFPAVAPALSSRMRTSPLHKSITAPYAAGARDFLVWRAPNVGLTLAIRRLNQISPGAMQLATGLTQAFNAGLDGFSRSCTPGLPGIRIVQLDAYRLLNDLVDKPGVPGLTNVGGSVRYAERSAVHFGSPDDFLVPGTAFARAGRCTRSSRRKRHSSSRTDFRADRRGGLRAALLPSAPFRTPSHTLRTRIPRIQ